MLKTFQMLLRLVSYLSYIFFSLLSTFYTFYSIDSNLKSTKEDKLLSSSALCMFSWWLNSNFFFYSMINRRTSEKEMSLLFSCYEGRSLLLCDDWFFLCWSKRFSLICNNTLLFSSIISFISYSSFCVISSSSTYEIYAITMLMSVLVICWIFEDK